MFHVIDLSLTRFAAPLVSAELDAMVRAALADKKKVLMYLNRRGAGNAAVCKDCGHALPCPKCDVAAKAHERPARKLACHQCGWEGPVPTACPKCGGANLEIVGTRIQRVEEGLEKLYPEAKIARLDSDVRRLKKADRPDLAAADIVLGTQAVTAADVPDLGLAAFLLLDAEAMSGDWRAEERAYCQAALNAKRGVPVVLQAYHPEHPLVRMVAEGNYRDFFMESMAQRRAFGYPPYRQMAEIAVTHAKQERVDAVVTTLVEKLALGAPDDGELLAPKAGWARVDNEWVRKIALRAKDAYAWLLVAEKELHGFREARVEWK
jgi:primosomal protein N' (replication factor Y)